MDYVKPTQLIEDVAHAGAYKSTLKISDILIKGILSGAFLGFATTLTFTATIETKLSIVGALVFPVGFVLVLLLSLELVTGNLVRFRLIVFELMVISLLKTITVIPSSIKRVT
nr:formate/nitrite transporter family protein [Fredinandcohnia onubensis]